MRGGRSGSRGGAHQLLASGRGLTMDSGQIEEKDYHPSVSLRSPLVVRARELAERAHAGQLRKVGNIPYFNHVDSVAKLVAAHGVSDPLTLAAAYLHDVLEDQPRFSDELRGSFPAEVVETVVCLTELKRASDGSLRSKRERFAGYLENLRAGGPAARRAIPISCADKIHNMLSIVEAERSGPGLLSKLSTRPGEHQPQLDAVRVVYAPVVPASLLAAFDQASAALLATIERWLPGRAAQIAAEVHLGQFDRAGEPYIYHPFHLALRAEGSLARTTALLHDVVEDSHWTLEELAREGFSREVLRALDRLKRGPTETYEAFIDRAANNRSATQVKLLDLEHNSDLSRLGVVRPADEVRVAKYQRSMCVLRQQQRLRSLQVVLDEPSAQKLTALATFPIVVAKHVTLAYRVDPDALDPTSLGRHRAGDTVKLVGVALHRDERVQAIVVELDGTSARADGGILHVTVSRQRDARSRESNEMLRTSPGEEVRVPMSGTARWVKS